MKMSPHKPYNNDSYAELQVYDAFRSVSMPGAICFNSLHLVSHREKKMGEIDFALVCAKGIFVFEVKGGRIFQNDGKWFSRSKQKDHSIHNPFNQSRGALFSLLDSLKSQKLITPDVPIGYGVLVPNSISLKDSVEYSSEMYGTKNCLKNFSGWLEQFIYYWVSKLETPKVLTEAEVSMIANYLRPESLQDDLQDTNDKLLLNAKQKQVVNAFEIGKKIICDGAAGTGKTHIIGVLAADFVKSVEKVLILCESRWLKGYLKAALNASNIVVATIDSVQIESRRNFVSQYDVVIVDEAQDFYQSRKLSLLEQYIKGGFDSGRWVFFQDLINQAGFFNQPEQSSINRIIKASDIQLKLDMSYRYSRATLNYLADILGTERINTKKIKGPKICEFTSIDSNDELNQIENAIKNVLKNGYHHTDITLLSNLNYHESAVSSLPIYLTRQIIQLDDFNVQHFPLIKMSFSELQNFKGLDNQVVILVDFNREQLINTPEAYVALTRAISQLVIVWQTGGGSIKLENKFEYTVGLLEQIDNDFDIIVWQEVLSFTVLREECELFIKQQVPPPECGYELVVNHAVVAETELAWVNSKVCIFSDEEEIETIEKFDSEGWLCFQAPLNELELKEILLSRA